MCQSFVEWAAACTHFLDSTSTHCSLAQPNKHILACSCCSIASNQQKGVAKQHKECRSKPACFGLIAPYGLWTCSISTAVDGVRSWVTANLVVVGHVVHQSQFIINLLVRTSLKKLPISKLFHHCETELDRKSPVLTEEPTLFTTKEALSPLPVT